MATRSLELWEQFAADSGEDTGFNRCGLLYLSDDEGEIARWAKWRDFAKDRGRDHARAERSRGHRARRATGRAWKGGVFSPSDGTADPGKASPAVAAALMKLGAAVLQNCAARGIELEGGRVSGVVTEAGTIKTGTVVYAGGAWASSFCRQLASVSRRPRFVRRSCAWQRRTSSYRTPCIPRAYRSPAAATAATTSRSAGADVWIRRCSCSASPRSSCRCSPSAGATSFRADSKACAAATKRWRGGGSMRPRPWSACASSTRGPIRRRSSKTYGRAVELLPAFGKTSIASAWAGFVDSTPDGVPGIGEVPELPGFILAAGFSGHGFGIGPGAGHLIADLVTGAKPIFDPAPYNPARFRPVGVGQGGRLLGGRRRASAHRPRPRDDLVRVDARVHLDARRNAGAAMRRGRAVSSL
jgi:glycine/D-amino acid oxidase-like deaminating enzyme